MTMRVNIPSDLAAFVKEKLEVGRYRDASEAITDGLRLLKERDLAEYHALQRVLVHRVKESTRGKSVPFDAEVREGVRRRGMKRLAKLNATRGQ